MKRFEGIIESTTPPASKNVLWIDRGVPTGTSVPDTDTSEAATIQTVAATLNSLLASLRASGAIQS